MNMYCTAPDSDNGFNSSGPPIILIPGVMGSRLEKPDNKNNAASGMVWDPDNPYGLNGGLAGVAMMHTVDRANLFSVNKTFVHPCVNWSKQAKRELGASKYSCIADQLLTQGWAGPSWTFYGNGLIALQELADTWGGKVYAFAYDWRRSTIDAGELLAEKIAEVRKQNDNKKVLLVTHSMGGLVSRAACKMYGAESNVLGVVHTLHPAYGTPTAYRLFKMGGASAPSWLDGMGQGVATIQGRTVEQYAIVSHGTRGPFELLPNQYMHACTGQESTQLPGQHTSAPLSWLSLDTVEPNLTKYISNAKSVYDYYEEPRGLVGLIDFNYWGSNENRYVFDKGPAAAAVAATIVSPIAAVVLAAATVKKIYGPQVRDGVRAGIQAARRYHLEQVKDYAHPNTCVIAGDDNNMVCDLGFSISVTLNFSTPSYNRVTITAPPDSKGHSDGTVSLASATSLRLSGSTDEQKLRQKCISKIAHADAFGTSSDFTELVRKMCNFAIAHAVK